MAREIDSRKIEPRIKLEAKLVAEWPEVGHEALPVERGDPEIDVTGMAVEVIGMKRKTLGKNVELGRKRVHPVVAVEPDHRQPEFSPARDRQHAAMRLEPGARL